MHKERVAIQGFEGSFHQMAAYFYFDKKVDIVCCATFRELIEQAQNPKRTTAALMAIENSIVGSILPNYSLLRNSTLEIVGEVYLEIKQQLIALPHTSFSQITEVHSHPMAILQCSDFLEQSRLKIVETQDTALSVRQIAQSGARHIAGIAGVLAAELYGMKIIRKNIHSVQQNYTRFLVLRRRKKTRPSGSENKVSLSFDLENKHGSLAQVLTRIHYRGLNLTKLQSFPIPGSRWEYFFHCDMEFANRSDLDATLKEISSVTKNIQVYGIYEKGNTH